jgi:hypothetical protein
MPFDEMKITVLGDGTIRTTTNEVSKANHDLAEQFLRAMAKLAGGTTTREARKDRNPAHHHHHEGGHSHSH